MSVQTAQAQQLISFIIGAISPYIIAVFNNRNYSNPVRILIAAIVSLVLAVIQCVVTGAFKDVKDVATAFMTIWVTGTVVYKSVATSLGVRQLEAITTPGSAPASDPLPTTSTSEAQLAIAAEAAKPVEGNVNQ